MPHEHGVNDAYSLVPHTKRDPRVLRDVDRTCAAEALHSNEDVFLDSLCLNPDLHSTRHGLCNMGIVGLRNHSWVPLACLGSFA